MLVAQLSYQNKFKVQECNLEKAQGSREHGACGYKTQTEKQ